MRELRRRAQRLIAGVEAADPDVVALAEAVSLALSVDRTLLRAARRAWLRGRGPDVEADLWHSPLVASAGATGVVLDAAVRDELRIRLRADRDRYEAAYELIAREHAWLPDTLRLEEWLAFEALRPGGPQRARERLAALVIQVGEQPDLAPWLVGLHARLPTSLGDAGAGGLPGVGRGRRGADGTAVDGQRVDVRLLDGAVEFRAGTPSTRWQTLALPPHAPPLVHVDERLVDLDELPQLCPVGTGRRVSIETLDGSGVTLARAGRRAPDQSRGVLRGHRGVVLGVVFSPDGRLVVSGGADGVVRVWEVASGRAVVALAGHLGGVWGVAFSPDGRLVVSGGADRVVRVWEVASGRAVVAFAGHQGVVWGVAFSPDGRLVVSGGADRVVRVWEVASGRTVGVFADHQGGVWGVVFSPDGRLVVSGGGDRVVRVWEVASGREVVAFAGHAGVVRGVAFSPDGRLVASGGGDRVVRVWEVASGRAVVALAGHEGRVLGVSFSPDGRLVASGGDRVVRVWEVASGRAVVALAGHEGAVLGVAFSPDGRLVASGGEDEVVRVWEVASGREVVVFAGHQGGVRGVAFSPDGRLVVSGGADRVVRVWEVASGRTVVEFAGHEGRVLGVAFSPDGRLVVSGGDDRVVRVWEVASGREVAEFAGHEGRVLGVAFSPDGRLVVSGGGDGLVRVREVASGRAVVFAGHEGGVWGVAFSRDGRLVVSGGGGGVVRVWEVASGREVVGFAGHEGVVFGVAFSPDGRLVVSGGGDRVVRVWDVGAPASAALRGPVLAGGALAAGAIELASDRVRWTALLGIGGGALPAALLATGLDAARIRDLLVRGDLAGLLVPPARGRGRAGSDRAREARFATGVRAALLERGMRDWGDLAVPAADVLHASALQLALLDVATGRVAILPRDAARLGIDLAGVSIAALVIAAMGGVGGERTFSIGGRRLGSALDHPIDLRETFADQPASQPVVLIDAGSAPHPRTPSAPSFTTVRVPRAPAGGPARPSRAQREVLALVGADAARRAIDGLSLADPPLPIAGSTRTGRSALV